MSSPEERTTLYVKVSDLWKKYESFRTLLISTSTLCSHTSNVISENLSCGKKLYRAVASDHRDMMVMVFLQCILPTDEKIKIALFGLNRLMRELI